MRLRAALAAIGITVAACSGPAATLRPAATVPPSAPASPPVMSTTSPSQVVALPFSVPRAALAAVRRFDLALIAAQSGGELSQSDYRAYEPHLVILRLSLGDGSVPLAKTNYAALGKQVASDAAKLTGLLGQVVTRDFELLGSVLDATPLAPGVVAAGSHYTGTFAPGILLTLGDGWSLVTEDATVVAIAKDGVTLAVTHQADVVSSAAVVAILTAGSGVPISLPPGEVDIGAFHGWSGSVAREGTLWATADGITHLAAPGSTVRAWVLDVNHVPLTIVADGGGAAMTAIATDLDRTLGTILAP